MAWRPQILEVTWPGGHRAWRPQGLEVTGPSSPCPCPCPRVSGQMPVGCRPGPGPPWGPWRGPPTRLCPLRRRWPEARGPQPSERCSPQSRPSGSGGREGERPHGLGPQGRSCPPGNHPDILDPKAWGATGLAPPSSSLRLRCWGRGACCSLRTVGLALAQPTAGLSPPQTGSGGPRLHFHKSQRKWGPTEHCLPSQHRPEGRLVGEAGPEQAAHRPGQSWALMPRLGPRP